MVSLPLSLSFLSRGLLSGIEGITSEDVEDVGKIFSLSKKEQLSARKSFCVMNSKVFLGIKRKIFLVVSRWASS